MIVPGLMSMVLRNQARDLDDAVVWFPGAKRKSLEGGIDNYEDG